VELPIKIWGSQLPRGTLGIGIVVWDVANRRDLPKENKPDPDIVG
jgi:hypothetical protein